MTDYPDWQSFSNAQSDNLFQAPVQTLTPGLHSTPVLPAANWSSLTMMATPTAGAAQMRITHLADLAGAQVLGSDTWPVNPATHLVVRSPLRSRYVRLDTIVTSAGNFTAVTWANFLSAASDRISFPVGNQHLAATGKALAASGTDTYTVAVITAGLGYLYFKPADATGKLAVQLRVISETGVAGQPVADLGTPAALTQQLVTVPDLIVQALVVNTDPAGPHTYDLSLTVPPQ